MREFEELEEKIRETIGVRLFTVLAWIPERRALRRVHSSHPEQYPVGGEKTVEVAQGWLSTCIEGREPYLGPDRAAVREIFADHELIESLGCGAVINVPVVDRNRDRAVDRDRDGLVDRAGAADRDRDRDGAVDKAVDGGEVLGGEVLGVLNILDAEGAYDEESVELARSLAPLAVPALREAVPALRGRDNP
ncbi:GAF domain-containing protein [Nonomuraea rhizosphaerae]|uniref:GAF domain-containing protein n=1 Tax=Nonomuraea rhizosphaerae TaxID=2665663 RepID=UPI001C5F59A7|nr:GAF domain-containing protein [Nonomuraea rhizosphaerae]